MTIVTGYHAERPVTSCMTLNFAGRAFYYIAATGAEGRKLSAAYGMLPRLVASLRESGIRYLDFGGIAPQSSERAGVDHFKKGFGGEIVEYLGEWEAASVPLLAPLAGIMMRWRKVSF
jgi:lipid II:glycine glycyltransferase (peptidoglycan interpeptide bridge formation enzyme)